MEEDTGRQSLASACVCTGEYTQTHAHLYRCHIQKERGLSQSHIEHPLNLANTSDLK